MIAKNMFDFAAFIEQDFGNARREAVAIAHPPEHGGKITLRRFMRRAEELPLAVKKPDATVGHCFAPMQLCATSAIPF